MAASAGPSADASTGARLPPPHPADSRVRIGANLMSDSLPRRGVRAIRSGRTSLAGHEADAGHSIVSGTSSIHTLAC
jgi:hypothetical protein